MGPAPVKHFLSAMWDGRGEGGRKQVVLPAYDFDLLDDGDCVAVAAEPFEDDRRAATDLDDGASVPATNSRRVVASPDVPVVVAEGRRAEMARTTRASPHVRFYVVDVPAVADAKE